MDPQPGPHLADPRDVRVVSVPIGMESDWRQRCHVVIPPRAGLVRLHKLFSRSIKHPMPMSRPRLGYN
jgi:hypothetical protein